MLRRACRHALLPGTIYLVSFSLLASSWLPTFFTEFWGDRMDALQNAWNLWWVDLALRHPDLHPSIWETNLLHWPFGTTLLAHPLSPFNGYLGMLLQSFLSLIPTYNLLIVFALVMSGLTTYWLAYDLTRSQTGGLAAGFTFAFSSFALMHIDAGQLDMASTEWIPLFLLCWLGLLRRPRPALALAAALALWLVALCTQYFLLYCIIAGALTLAWHAAIQKDALFVTRREYAVPLLIFAGLALLLIGPQVVRLVISDQHDPFTGAHNAAAYSMDLLAFVIPGRHWLFGAWTQPYWSRLVQSAKEGEAYLALPVYLFVAYLWIRRRALDPHTRQQLYLWSTLMGVFFLLALGPVLHIAGRAVSAPNMPYALVTGIVPTLGLSGIPARMSVMVVLSGSLLTAFAIRTLLAHVRAASALTFGLLAIIVFQMLPAPIATTSVRIPDYITALAAFKEDGGTINLVGTNPSVWLYYQTVHGKPIAFGYIARLPATVLAGDQQLQAAIDSRDWSELWLRFRIRYVIAAEELAAPSNTPDVCITLLYERKGLRLYRLGPRCELAP